MDFGLSRIVEVFEERFGRRASSILILIIAVGAASLGIRLTYENIISPTYKIGMEIFYSGASGNLHEMVNTRTKYDIYFVISWLTMVAIISTAAKLWADHVRRKANKIIDAYLEEAEKKYQCRISKYTELLVEAESAIRTFKEEKASMTRETERKLWDISGG